MQYLCKTPSIERTLWSLLCIGALLGVLRLLEASMGVWKTPLCRSFSRAPFFKISANLIAQWGKFTKNIVCNYTEFMFQNPPTLHGVEAQ